MRKQTAIVHSCQAIGSSGFAAFARMEHRLLRATSKTGLENRQITNYIRLERLVIHDICLLTPQLAIHNNIMPVAGSPLGLAHHAITSKARLLQRPLFWDILYIG